MTELTSLIESPTRLSKARAVSKSPSPAPGFMSSFQQTLRKSLRSLSPFARLPKIEEDIKVPIPIESPEPRNVEHKHRSRRPVLTPLELTKKAILRATSSENIRIKAKYFELLCTLSFQKTGIPCFFDLVALRSFKTSEVCCLKLNMLVHHLLQNGGSSFYKTCTLNLSTINAFQTARLPLSREYAAYLCSRVKFIQIQEFIGTLDISGNFCLENVLHSSFNNGKSNEKSAKVFVENALKAVSKLAPLSASAEFVLEGLVELMETSKINQDLLAMAMSQVFVDIVNIYRLATYLVCIAAQIPDESIEEAVTEIQSSYLHICSIAFKFRQLLKLSCPEVAIPNIAISDPQEIEQDGFLDDSMTPEGSSSPSLENMDWVSLYGTFKDVILCQLDAMKRPRQISVDSRLASHSDCFDSTFDTIPEQVEETVPREKSLRTRSSSNSVYLVPAEKSSDPSVDPSKVIFMKEMIGSGGWSQVYRGIFNGKAVAVKTLKASKMGKKDLEDFEAEVHMLKRLRHPNIVQYVASSVDFKNPFLVTELLEMSLFDMIHNRHLTSWKSLKFTWKMRVEMSLDIAHGVQYLHSLTPPIIHRDLKSPNLLLDRNLSKSRTYSFVSLMIHRSQSD
jgi:hypothetical protein